MAISTYLGSPPNSKSLTYLINKYLQSLDNQQDASRRKGWRQRNKETETRGDEISPDISMHM